MCLSVASMNLKEQCEGQQQRHFQDMSSDREGSSREDIMTVNVAKPAWCRGMICHFLARDDPSGEAATKGTEEKVSIWHSYNCQGWRKGCCGNQGTSN